MLALRSRRVDRSRRTPGEDALTLLDEAALVLAADPARHGAVVDARARGDLDALDRLVGDGAVTVAWLGHALVEHALHRRAPIGAGVVVVATGDAASADAILAAAIAADAFDRPRLSPNLPWPDVRVDRWLCASWTASDLARRGRQMRP